jgi:hypothetical protein
MPHISWKIVDVVGLKTSTQRGIVFLVGGDCGGKENFDGLGEKLERLVRNRMEHWIDGFRKDEYHHGWPNQPDNKECYCFKWKLRKVHQRLYGFLCNPSTKDARFRLCVLAFFDTKTVHDTDSTILAALNKLRVDPGVKGAIATWLRLKSGDKNN